MKIPSEKFVFLQRISWREIRSKLLAALGGSYIRDPPYLMIEYKLEQNVLILVKDIWMLYKRGSNVEIRVL
jgi:hypothetical protein